MEPVRVEPVRSERGVRLAPDPGHRLNITGTARQRLDLPTSIGRGSNEAVIGEFDLSPIDRLLVIRDGLFTATVVFDGAVAVADLSAPTAAELAEAQDLLRELTGVFGLQIDKGDQAQAEAAPFIDLLIEVRKGLRDEEQWALSDLVRDRLKELGVVLEDSKEGTTWRWE